MPPQNSHKISWNKAIVRILVSVLLLSGAASAATFFFFRFREGRANDSRYDIVAVVQSCHQNEGLKTSLLVELLQLSVDQPANLYRFDVNDARQKLFECPIIQMAEIQKIMPGTLYIEYSYRKPVAYISDYSNTAVDDQGVLIPFKPYYTPKNIPELIIGFENNPSHLVWGTELRGAKSYLAFSLLKVFNEHFAIEGCTVRCIDISKAFETSCGQREIVISLDERLKPPGRRILRLTVEHYPQQLANYLALRPLLNEEFVNEEASSLSNLVVDMRIPKLAYINRVR
ncbi:MAG: hypothetical protein H0U49_12810 [Parachlamydiaceae bacterium]|nr:hypothetical protein [Parachlamydiaceae bacterium]